jgi:glycosyltransferase involved in cell wall biosynthesis
MKKILMLLESNYPPDLRVENEIGTLIEADHHVTLLCRGTSDQVETDRGLTIIRRRISKFRAKTAIAHPWLRYYESFWRRHAFALISRHQFDVIHVHDLPLARVGYELSRVCGARFVLDLHENWPALLHEATHTKKLLGRIFHSDQAWQRFEERYVTIADRVIVVSELSAERIVSAYFLLSPFVAVVRNTVNLDTMPTVAFTPAPADGILRIFYGGGLNKHRGIQTAIEAMKIINARGHAAVMLMIVGEGSYRKTLQRQAVGMPNVVFKHQKSFPDFMRLLSESHIAIIPHLRNANNDTTCPHKIFQAMYAGVTVLASNCPYLMRVITDANCGYWFEAGDAELLAGTIEAIDHNRKLLDNGRNGIKAVLEKYNWAIDTKVLTEMYKGLK